MSEAKQSKIDFEVWEYILPALPMIAEVSAKGFDYEKWYIKNRFGSRDSGK